MDRELANQFESELDSELGSFDRRLDSLFRWVRVTILSSLSSSLSFLTGTFPFAQDIW